MATACPAAHGARGLDAFGWQIDRPQPCLSSRLLSDILAQTKVNIHVSALAKHENMLVSPEANFEAIAIL